MKAWKWIALVLVIASLSAFVIGIFVGRSSIKPAEPVLVERPDPVLQERIINLRADSARLSQQSERLAIELAAERTATPPVKNRISHAHTRSAALAFDTLLKGLHADPPEFD